MKSLFTFVLALGLAGAALAQGSGAAATSAKGQPTLKPIDFRSDPAAMEFAKEAGSQAIQQWVSDFVAKKFDAKTYAFLPVQGDIDGGYFRAAAEAAFAEAVMGTDFGVYTSKNDPMFETLSKEMFQELDVAASADIFNQETIQKFRRVNVAALVVGRIAGIYYAEQPTQSGVQVEGFEQKSVQVRVIFRAYENSTGRLLWGGERVASVTLPSTKLTVKRDWILWTAAGLGVLFLLFILHRMLLGANRPR
jgi:hypothetical protein